MRELNINELKFLGYNEFFEAGRIKLNLENFLVARVTSEQKGSYKVKNPNGEYVAKITGKQIFNAQNREDYPAVGDWVAIEETNNNQAIIRGVLPRKTILKRKSIGKNEVQVIATNIDVTFVVESVNNDFNLNRLERYVALVRDGGIEPIIVLNKIDLNSKEELGLKIDQVQKRISAVKVILTSSKQEGGLDNLRQEIKAEKTYCFLGSSGVGKSSIIKKLVGNENIKTEAINLTTDKGKHTTTSREMYFLENGGILIDNPGMREVGMVDSNSGISSVFNDILTLSLGCKYTDCTHIHEPGCAVRTAVATGKLDQEMYDNFTNLKKEADFYKLSKLEKRQKDKKFGKFFKKKMNELRDYGHKDY